MFLLNHVKTSPIIEIIYESLFMRDYIFSSQKPVYWNVPHSVLVELPALLLRGDGGAVARQALQRGLQPVAARRPLPLQQLQHHLGHLRQHVRVQVQHARLHQTVRQLLAVRRQRIVC